jgi:hypothetical protein
MCVSSIFRSLAFVSTYSRQLRRHVYSSIKIVSRFTTVATFILKPETREQVSHEVSTKLFRGPAVPILQIIAECSTFTSL